MATKVPQGKLVGGVAAGFAAVLLALASPVHAQNPGDSAVNQYVEMVPAAGGPKSPGVEKKERRSLRPAANAALEQASPPVARSLEEIATSSTYGAPVVRAKPKPAKPQPGVTVRDPDIVPSGAPTDIALATTVSAIASATDERLFGLLLAVLTTTLGAVALAIGRARAG